MQRHLRQRQPRDAPDGPRRRGLAGDARAQSGGEDGLPAFHPQEKQAHPGRAEGGMLAGKSAAAHVGPKIKEGQDEGERADGISGVELERRAAQEVDGFFHHFEHALARLAVGCFHSTALQNDFQRVPSW